MDQKQKAEHTSPIRQASSSLSLRQIPYHLVQKILLKVPIKSLVRFMITSKEWQSLVNQKRYLCTHLTRQCPLFLHVKVSELWTLEIESPSSLCYTEIKNFRERRIRSVSECDGLILCHTLLDRKTNLLLWNPTRKENYRCIEKEDFSLYDHFCLGWDDQLLYKIMRFTFGRFEPNREIYESAAEVFDVSSNCWKCVGMEDDWELYKTKVRSVSIQGNSYWLAMSKRNKVFVQQFDFTKESFCSLAIPLGMDEMSGITALSAFQGQNLLLLNQHPQRATCDLWITENGTENWEKHYTVTGFQPLLQFPTFFLNKDKVTMLNETVSEEGVGEIKLIEITTQNFQQTPIDQRYVHNSQASFGVL